MKFQPLLAPALAAFTALALSATESAPPAPAQVDGFSYVKTVGAISEYTLDANGLDVLLLPEHSARSTTRSTGPTTPPSPSSATSIPRPRSAS